MSVESIVNHILDEASAQAEQIIEQAKKEKSRLIAEAQKEALALKQEILKKEKKHQELERQRLIVASRLESKNRLLEAKQELVSSVLNKIKSELKADKFKKQQISHQGQKTVAEDVDFYLKDVRLEHENSIAKILFG